MNQAAGWFANEDHMLDEEDLPRTRRKAPDAMRLKLSNFFGVEDLPEQWVAEDLLSPTFSVQTSSSQQSDSSLRRISTDAKPSSPHGRSLSDCPSPPFKSSLVKGIRSKSSFTNFTNFFRPLRSPSNSAIPSLFAEIDDSLPKRSAFSPMMLPIRCRDRNSLPREELSAARAFWLLRLIRQSVFTGAHITPRLFIPPTLWRQTRPKLISRMAQKAQHLQWLSAHLDNMAECDLAHPTQARIQLDLLDSVVHMIQSSQPKDDHLSVRSVASIMKNLVSKDKPRRGSLPEIFDDPPSSPNLHPLPFSVEDYSLAIVHFVDSCQTLELWYDHFLWEPKFSPPPSIKHGLYRATAFLSHSILHSLFEDVTSLLAAYIEGMNSDLNT